MIVFTRVEVDAAQEDVEHAGEVAKDVRAAAPDDHDVARSRRLFDHVLRDLQHRLARVEGGVGVGRSPGRSLGRDQRLGAGGAERDKQPREQRARLLVLGLDLLLRQLEPVRDLVDDPRLEQVGLQLAGEHLPHGRAPRPELTANRDDRHGVGSNLRHQAVR